uniref:LAGLIDADG endonuclease n=1 Tax=Chrysoporthe austroafricana TaxID=354353 RepID=A0A191MWT6_9PEZI|nr:LAGLIDADG endonuclease [Chrysoporthe austroafricana]AMX22141.1 LAGLIDADG endonuclease [Chrysoporthe austroafricana]
MKKFNILLACSCINMLSFRLPVNVAKFSSICFSSFVASCIRTGGRIGFRYIHVLPANPTNHYKSIQAIVIKDRSPIGKFKFKPSAKGVVTVFITIDGLFHNDSILSTFYGESLRRREMLNAFTSHLDEKEFYTVTLLARKGKHNLTLIYPPKGSYYVNRERIINEFDSFVSWMRGEVQIHFDLDIARYRDRLIKLDYLKIVFSPYNVTPEGGDPELQPKVEDEGKMVNGENDNHHSSQQNNNYNSRFSDKSENPKFTAPANSLLPSSNKNKGWRRQNILRKVHTMAKISTASIIEATSREPNIRKEILGNEMASLLGNGKKPEDMTWFDFFDKLRGWTDGEGSFLIKRKPQNNSLSYGFRFEIGMHKDDLSLLEFIHTTLGLGSVYTYGDSSHFMVNKLAEIKIIISIFDKFTLNTTKYLNFLDFSRCYFLYVAKPERDITVLSDIEEIRQGMNSRRTNFTLPKTHKFIITPYWLLAFVEGEGSFHVEKNDYFRLIFSITQVTVDLAVLELIKEFLIEHSQLYLESNSQPVVIYARKKVYKTNHKLSSELKIRDVDFIRQNLIPLFDNLIWHTKKKQDFQDWIAILKLKEKGHHYHESGRDLIYLILDQMNNNRLSSYKFNKFNKINREDFEVKINNLLAAPSNLEIINGRTFIISEQRYTNEGKGKPLNNPLILVDKQDESSIIRTFVSQTDCAKYFGVSESTISNRLKKGLNFDFDDRLVFLRKKGND